MKDKIKRYFSIPDSRKIVYDYIRVISCIGIICLHATGDRADKVGVFFETISRVALPMFVLLSGVLVLGNPKIEPYSKFYGKRFVKILIPYLLYGAVYIGWVYENHTIPEKLTLEKLKTAIKDVPVSVVHNLREPMYFHLWFMMMIMGFYVVAPFIQRGLTAFKDKDLKCLFLVILFVYTVVDYMPIIGINIGITNFFSNWIIYFLAGYIIIQFDNKKTHIFFSIMGILSMVLMYIWKMYYPAFLSSNFYDLAPHMMMATCGLFSLMLLIEPLIIKLKCYENIQVYIFNIYDSRNYTCELCICTSL